MAKNYDFAKAKALYGIGKTPRQIEIELGIPRSTFQRKANEEGWEKGGLNSSISDVVRVVENLSQKSEPESILVQKEAKRILNASGRIQEVSMIAINRLADLMECADDMKDVKAGVDALKAAMITSGVVQFYPNAATINNTNAQQNNEKVIRVEHSPTIADV
jgi:hypothetical protein